MPHAQWISGNYREQRSVKMAVKKFLIMVGNDVAGEMVFEDVFAPNKKLYSALIDGLDIVELEADADVAVGYFYDGESYTPPPADNP